MSDLSKIKNYEVKIRIKHHDLPKTRMSEKTINCNFPNKSIVTSSFLDFRVLEKEKEREFIPYKEVWSFLIFHIPTVAH